MNRTETLAIMSVLKAAYPRYYADMTYKDADGVVNLWTEMFADDPAPVVAMAVKSLIATDTKGFPPHIGAVKDAIVKIQKPKEMTEQEAWGLVSKALRNGIYGANEEFEKLPPVVQKIVGNSAQLTEWAMMDSDVVQSVVASNFMRSYRARAVHEREFMALPSDVKAAMMQIADGMKMPELESGGKQ